MGAPYNPHMRAVVSLQGGEVMTIKGRQAQAIAALHKAGSAGINAAQMSSWALRLGHYIFTLRRLGFDIETRRVKFVGGWYGQYVLHTPIDKINVHSPPPKKAKPATAATVQALNSNSKHSNVGGKND